MALLLVAGAAACTAETTTGSDGDKQASPFADCAALTAALAPGPTTAPVPGSPTALAPGSTAGPVPGSTAGPVPGSTAAASTAAGSAGSADLPDLQLPCFTGGKSVRLSELRGPAVINLWASWCVPCREELPAMQRLADATAGRLHVIGVDSGDDRDAAVDFATDRKVTLPTLSDPDKKLLGRIGRVNIPITVFIDAAGKRLVYDQAPPDDAQLAALVRAHTGVTVKS